VKAETKVINIAVRPVIRYVLTKYESGKGGAGSEPLGEFESVKHANYIGQQVAKAQECDFEAAPHLRIKWADDPNIARGEHECDARLMVISDNEPEI
jgi:hypothetical protein